ncbi:hypothetical protein NEUTE1DRAFT_48561 [Neurospora tetrasperma FGSC 2508]|uniref:Fe2OG dioxygenase domain-containing protein n=1 Tax=Neurospora tetrasperma (strain FGSC 2508 / ATCC MYA-4615 / P0657) TaxID=510951 RepID=F8MW96_NEUT8|nr:uncharacterized protein NEUTE1DRAFT_48561 [Neurospora tetrasperma FGSC 2508]EGO54891.1 hypothetical protein NEUTE1DRAFT_48561 [Neurospora tetrasperma FGSC 2508]EGZ67617.1 Clavaminate synthase-like protein [Neurospora tetrasperma FGSC 2509]
MSTQDQQPATTLRLASGNGPITRSILPHPPRDALPSELPIISLAPLFSPSSSLSSRLEVAKQIHQAATTNGFFYITSHGISSSVIQEAQESAFRFFRSPVSEKEKASMHNSLYKYGWKPPRTQRLNPFESVDHRESFSWRYDPRYDPNVRNIEEEIPDEVKAMIKHDPDDYPWSAVPPEFKAAVIRYFQAVLQLGRILQRAFALSLGLEETAFDEKSRWPDLGMAVNYYPPLSGGVSGEKEEEGDKTKVSIGSHTDFQLFTILGQDEVGGLQVLSRSGQWLNAKPIPGTFVVNFGDYMQRITNDKYVSTVHRVQNYSGKERLSMAFFFGFNLNETCEVLESCVEEGEEPKYEAVSCWEWTQRRVRMMHDVKGDGS